MNALKIVREEAYTLATSTQPRKSVHVLSHLSCAFVKSGYSSMQSDELAEQWLGRFLQHFETFTDRTWSAEGIDPPLYASTLQADVLLGVNHKYFRGGTTGENLRIIEFVKCCEPREFVWSCAVALAYSGASRVYVVDGSNDGGIDVLGLYQTSPIQALCISIQAKAWTGVLSGQHVEDVVNKYLYGLQKPVWHIYDSLIDINSQPGFSRALVIASRDGFGSAALPTSRKLANVCWNSYKIGSLIPPTCDYERFSGLVNHLSADKIGRTTNIVPMIL